MAEEARIEKSIPEKITDTMIEKLAESGQFSQTLIEELAIADLSNIEGLKQLLLNQTESNENTETGN
ncbi:hypothetical protein [Fluviicola taffensis]|uniref:hypothetical protein n=1 Tax=Fluviicola taffensis TaxID=191579 RepID=UPI00313818CE